MIFNDFQVININYYQIIRVYFHLQYFLLKRSTLKQCLGNSCFSVRRALRLVLCQKKLIFFQFSRIAKIKLKDDNFIILKMSKDDHALKNIHFKQGGAARIFHHLPQNHSKMERNTSRRFKSVNLSVNPSLYNYKLENEVEDANNLSTNTIDVNRAHEIYFNKAKKYNYMRQIIDKYFEETKREKLYKKLPNPESSPKNYRTIIPKISKQIEHKELETIRNSQERAINREAIGNKRKLKLQTINKQEEEELGSSSKIINPSQQKLGQDSLVRGMSFSSTKVMGLPQIDEMFEDKDEQIQYIPYESISILNDSLVESVKEDRILISQNEIATLQLVTINGRLSHKIKTFKQKGQQILKRQLRAHLLGVESNWIQYKYNPNSLISNPNKSIKQLLFKARKVDAQGKFFSLKPGKYHKKLISNNCDELIRVIKQFCNFMQGFEGKVLNNKVNISNLYLTKTENIRLGQWGFASFKQTHMIQNMQFQNRIEPIVKSQKQWFVPPQYLAPQILRAIVHGQDIDIMQNGSAPDIWSLGLAVLQILTIIPIWIPQKCSILGKANLPRSGLLSIGDRDLKKLVKKQQKLPYLWGKLIEEQWESQNYNKKLIQFVSYCLTYDPQQRPTFADLIDFFK